MQDSATPRWREAVEKHHSAIIDELSASIDSDLASAVARARAEERAELARNIARAADQARRAETESLNQALRRLRQAESEEKTLQLLNESCAFHSRESVVLVFENHQARVLAARGFGSRGKSGVTFPIDDAPAILSALESRDPVVSLASSEQIAPVLATLFESEEGGDESEKVYLFPIVVRHATVALIIAAGEVASPPVELLSEAAAMRIESISIGTQTAAPAAAIAEKRKWEELSPEDQALHLQAQRMARVRVAEIRLGHTDALNAGIAASDIYGALKGPIDAARQQFLQTFLSKSSSMVDYLHLEILHVLVNDKDQLLGLAYPGPMV